MGSDLSPAVTAEEQRRVSYASLPLPADTTVNSIASQSMNLSLIAQDTSFANSVEDVAAPSLLSLDDIAGGVVENIADPEAQAHGQKAANEEAQDEFDDEDDVSDFIPDEEDFNDEDGGVLLEEEDITREMIENELSRDPEDIEEDEDVSETADEEAEPTAPIPLSSAEKEASRKLFGKRVTEIIDVLLDIRINAKYDPEDARSLGSRHELFGAKKIAGTEQDEDPIKAV
ncbi:hypothetical protein FQN53_004935 [Emmonsiellopsis sp. PD_33]|nr:hypothetical protein FQN53_004935 [Emmonsiellopsis sp. PD_33]